MSPAEIPGEIDDVRPEVADRAGAGLSAIEAPDALVGIPAPALQIGGPEVDDVADAARLQDLPREPHSWDEAVVEAAHVLDAGSVRLHPHAVRLVGVHAERLLAEDVLAVASSCDRRLGVQRVRPAVVEETDPRSATCSRQSVTASAQP